MGRFEMVLFAADDRPTPGGGEQNRGHSSAGIPGTENGLEVFNRIVRLQRENCIFVDHGRPPARVSRHLIHREWFGLARGYAYRCRRTIAIAAIMPKGIRMKSAMRMPIAKPFASGERPGGTATNRVSQSSSFMVPSELRIQYTDIAAVTD
jgi:hypothetical protein